MTDHGMTDFSDATHQGEWGEDSNGNSADFGNGALNALDHQTLVKGPAGMAFSYGKNKSVFDKGFGDLKADMAGVDMKDWNSVKGKLGGIRTEMGKADGKYKDFLHKGRGAIGIDPLKWLVGTLVDFLVQTFQPLEDILGVVSGNEARMNVSAKMWSEVADAMPPITEYMNTAATEELANWQGQDGDTARTRIIEMGLMVNGLGILAMGMSQVLQMMAGVAQMARKLVQMGITEGVVWVIEKIAPMMAASIATFGAAAPVCVAMTVAKIAGLVPDAIKMINAAMQFFQSVSDFFNYVSEIFMIMRPFLDRMIDVPVLKSV